MKNFKLYIEDGILNYEAEQIFEIKDKIFLIESNKKIVQSDILIEDSYYDIKNDQFYIMIVIDKANKSIIAKYGKLGYCHSFYYFKSDKDFFIDLHLSNIIKKAKFKLALDKEAVNEFVKSGFILNNKTLIQNIYKLPPLKTLFYQKDLELLSSKYVQYKDKELNYAEALKKELSSLDKIIIPLSGGYDSTLLSYLTKDLKDKYSFTVGSTKDVNNEFYQASITAKAFGFKQKLIYSDEYWVENFAKMVAVAEGESYDPGFFLSYYLAEEIEKENLTNYTVVSGDGADQLLNKNFYISNIDDPILVSRHEPNFYEYYPLQIFYNIITKKLEWFLHEKNINYCLPYVSEDFYNCSKNIKTTKKVEYKEFVENYLPQDTGLILKKKGGLVREKFFISSRIKLKFVAIIHKQKYKELFENDSLDLQPLLYKIYVILFEYIFIKGNNSNTPFITILNNIMNNDD